MPHRTYRSAADFRRALEDRLQDIAKREAVDLQRVRREVAFDRLLIRLFRGERPEKMPWALKGGYAMALRIQSARATKDIDLTVRIAGSADVANDALLQELESAHITRTPAEQAKLLKMVLSNCRIVGVSHIQSPLT